MRTPFNNLHILGGGCSCFSIVLGWQQELFTAESRANKVQPHDINNNPLGEYSPIITLLYGVSTSDTLRAAFTNLTYVPLHLPKSASQYWVCGCVCWHMQASLDGSSVLSRTTSVIPRSGRRRFDGRMAISRRLSNDVAAGNVVSIIWNWCKHNGVLLLRCDRGNIKSLGMVSIV